MLLVIDAGNTNFVFAVYDGEEMRGHWRISTRAHRTADEYAVWLMQLMALGRLNSSDITAAIIASVVPGATFHLIGLCRDHFGCQPMVIGAPGIELGIEIKIDTPSEAGADRLVNAVAARDKHGTPLIVIDIGTGTTFDVVDQDGNYAGGAIAPGPMPSLNALQAIAAKLPRIEIERPGRVIGKNTVGAMKSGLFWGYVGLIEGMVARIRAEFAAEHPTAPAMTVIATGGLAPLFDQACPCITGTDPDITIRGLKQIYEMNHRP